MATMRIALISGDGVGPEVIPVARRAIDALGLAVEWTELDWGSDHWRRTGLMMPPDALDVVRAHDAVLLGAVGDRGVPDDVSLWGLLLALRQGLDLWANERPVRLLPGVPSPLVGRDPTEVDMLFVRENSEGEYAGVGGRVHRGLAHETGIEVSVFTRAGVERVARHAFALAQTRRGRLVSATKSNASRYGYVLWDEVVAEVGRDFPEVELESVLVDALAARMVRDPGSLDVVVASNLFGDILTDLGAALQGGMGVAASANVAPGSGTPGIFEPVHGSAPDIADRGLANPVGAVWSAALLLDHAGRPEAGDRLRDVIARTLEAGPRTPDLGGSASTDEVGDAIVNALNRESRAALS